MDAFGTANNAMTCRLDGRPVPCDKLFREAGAGGISKINVSTTGGLGGVGGNTGAVMGVLVNSATSINGEKLRYNPAYNPDLDDPGPKYLPADFSPLALLAMPVELGQQGSAGNAASGLNKGPIAKFDGEKFKKCLKDSYFIDLTSWKFNRTGGYFKGKKGTQTLEVNINTTGRTAKQLGEQLKAIGVGDGRPNSGASFKSDPKTGYVASNVASDKSYQEIGVTGIAIHELGNSLAVQTTLADPYSGYQTKTARGENINDTDAGAAFENCVFGGLVGLQSGRVGPKRELK